ncbi:MAG: nucleotidyltransferase family protein [Bacteroidales bacterium]|jgi:molybdenum cofactor cytidylyltransferase|nr:nucleotidyltransferase family protein [Bacteroidales bacterium]
MNELWSIILAAGESKRMGSPKMLLPFGRTTIIETVIENVMNSQAGDCMVVLGAESASIIRVISAWPVKYCINDDYRKGMLSSVICGFRALPESFSAALVFPADQPLIKPRSIDMVISAFRESGRGIVIPVHEGRRGHPLLVSSRYRDEIYRLPESEGLRALAGMFPGDVIEIETGTDDILKDLDNQEEYRKEFNKHKRYGGDN